MRKRSKKIIFGDKKDFIISLSHNGKKISLVGPEKGFYGYKVLCGKDDDDGVFVEWSASDIFFTLKTDFLGMYPLYIKSNGHSLQISNNIDLLIKQNTVTLNESAIRFFMYAGYFLGSDTAFNEIFRPDGKLVIDFIKEEFDIQITRPKMAENDYIFNTDEYSKNFDNYIRPLKNCGFNLYLPLTGGKDSRHILFSVYEQDFEIDQSYTV